MRLNAFGSFCRGENCFRFANGGGCFGVFDIPLEVRFGDADLDEDLLLRIAWICLSMFLRLTAAAIDDGLFVLLLIT